MHMQSTLGVCSREFLFIHAVCECQVMAAESSKLQFTLNGQLVEVDNPDPQQLLVHWLRESGHTGTKVSVSKHTF